MLDQLRGALGALGAERAPRTRAGHRTPRAGDRRRRDPHGLDVVLSGRPRRGLGRRDASSPPPPAGPPGSTCSRALARGGAPRRTALPPARRGRRGVASPASLMSAWLTPLPATVTGVALLLRRLLQRGGLVPVVVVGRRAGRSRSRGPARWRQVSGLADDGADRRRRSGSWWCWTVGAVAVGRVAAGWQERVRRTAEVVARARAGPGRGDPVATAQERQALASELHDTVAHAMTVVCLQAGAHRRSGGRRRRRPPHDRDHRGGASPSSGTGWTRSRPATQPLDRSRLDRRWGGASASTSRSRSPSPHRGPGGGLAFRVVREAVVNVARHAPGASAEVRVTRGAQALSVEVARRRQRRAPVVTGAGRRPHRASRDAVDVGRRQARLGPALRGRLRGRRRDPGGRP